MTRIRIVAVFLRLVIFCFLGVCGCGNNNSSLAPFQPEALSRTDSFQLQATGVINRTVNLAYDWNNTGSQASVNHSTTTSAGTARVVIEDANGVPIYDRTLEPSLNEATTTGAAGTWKIRVELTHYSGTLNFRAQKL